jgi:hypothetical protein
MTRREKAGVPAATPGFHFYRNRPAVGGDCGQRERFEQGVSNEDIITELVALDPPRKTGYV